MSGKRYTPREIAEAYNAEAPEGDRITAKTVRREMIAGRLVADRIGEGNRAVWTAAEADAAEWLRSYTRYARK